MRTTAIVLSLFMAGTAQAHHGISNFDLNTDIELNGVVTRVQFVNPHSWLYLDVTDADGKTVAYTASRSREPATRLGVGKATLWSSKPPPSCRES